MLRLELNRPDRANAVDTAMRDALLEGLAVAIADPTVARVELSGAGPCFSSGGDLQEFGTAPDPVTSHLVRIACSVGAVLQRLRERTVVRLHGGCWGAGVEWAAFAGRVTAAAGTTCTLPELSMGLVPGAGGTVSVTRRIGRWRTAWLALSGTPLDADTALRWGLVDALTDGA